jgi:hypothetical protein
MPDVRSGQVWETRPNPKSAWRPVQVVDVLADQQVLLIYLDLPPGTPDLQKAFTVKPTDLDDRRRFRPPP